MYKLILFIFVSFGTIAQTDRLSELLEERKVLYNEWNQASNLYPIIDPSKFLPKR